MSIANGLPQVLDHATTIGFNTIAIFSSSPRIWKTRRRPQEEILHFKHKRHKTGISPIFLHALYLANPATSETSLYKKSIKALYEECRFCSDLNIHHLVIHPGSHRGNSLSTGIRQVSATIDILLENNKYPITILLETMTGGKSIIGSRFEHLRDIIAYSKYPNQISVCLDTCHIFSSGYDFRTFAIWSDTKLLIDKTIGLDKLCLIHVNDSQYPLGSHRDKHTHIGTGFIGIKGFKTILHDPDIRKLPLILETPKDREGSWDKMNLLMIKKILEYSI